MPPILGAAAPQRTSQQEGTMNTSTHPLGTLIETDVLVIGSGASGCGAALGAREQGVARPPHGQGQVGKLRLHRRRE